MMEVTAANVSKIVAMSNHDGHVGLEATMPYIEISSEELCAASINSDWNAHDIGIGGCIRINSRPVATTSTMNLFAGCA